MVTAVAPCDGSWRELPDPIWVLLGRQLPTLGMADATPGDTPAVLPPCRSPLLVRPPNQRAPMVPESGGSAKELLTPQPRHGAFWSSPTWSQFSSPALVLPAPVHTVEDGVVVGQRVLQQRERTNLGRVCTAQGGVMSEGTMWATC